MSTSEMNKISRTDILIEMEFLKSLFSKKKKLGPKKAVEKIRKLSQDMANAADVKTKKIADFKREDYIVIKSEFKKSDKTYRISISLTYETEQMSAVLWDVKEQIIVLVACTGAMNEFERLRKVAIERTKKWFEGA